MFDFVAKKIVGSRNDRMVKSLRPLVVQINDLEANVKLLGDEGIRNRISELKQEVHSGRPIEDLLPEVFALVREASVRTLEMRHFDVQLIGGVVLHRGMIAEMKTGEGKTLVATLAASLNALSGEGVHIVTVNDYLAKRDAEWMGHIYRFLGLSVGVVFSGLDSQEKRSAYSADITYGQNNEFGFDYLRDNMKFSLDDLVQRRRHYAIVDEVDSILIDEARTPLIISGPAEDSSEIYHAANKVIPHLKEGEHYDIDLRIKHPALNEEGIARVEQLLGVDNLYDPLNIELLHHVNQALKAHTCMESDVDYVVKDGEIMIVDEFTGRLMPGRRWSDGLHQAIEAKENLRVARENQTLASITFQNLFRLYDKLAGMTGTAATEAEEFAQIYGLDVAVIPTNQPMIRDDQTDVVFRTRAEKYQAVVEDLAEIYARGQPVLVGTISIEQSEALSRELKKKTVPHNVLNAKHHEREAEIVSQAGRLSGVTIATNMAGRGTDIILGGNPEMLARLESGTSDHREPAFQEAFSKYSAVCAEEKRKVLELGGLFIMGTERHEARRIDNQLRGRSGRQGDPGVSRFYVSLEDELMRRFGGERMQSLMSKMGWQEGMAIDGRIISRSIENAQKKVERHHFEARKHVTEYDDVMNKQRQVVYNLRNKILLGEGLREEVLSMVDDLLEEAVLSICDERQKPAEWNLNTLAERFTFLFNLNFPDFTGGKRDPQVIFDLLRTRAKEAYQEHAGEQQGVLDDLKRSYSPDGEVEITFGDVGDKAFDFQFATHEQSTLLASLDHFWNLHLRDMDSLRDVIGLRGYGQKNPKLEYQREGFEMFSSMLQKYREAGVRRLMFSDLSQMGEVLQQINEERKRREAIDRQMRLSHPDADGVGKNAQEAVTEFQPKDPDVVRAKMQAQRRQQRRDKKRRRK